MRRSSNSARRVFTIFSFVILFLSFAVFVDASPSPPSPFAHALALKRAPPNNTNTDNNPGNVNGAGDDAAGKSTTTTSTSSTSTTTSSSTSTSTSTSTSSTSTTTSTTPTTTSTSSTPSTTSTTPSTTSSSTSTTPSSTSSTTSLNSTTTAPTTLVATATPTAVMNGGGSTLIATNIGQFTTSATAPDPIETIDGNAAGNTSSGSSKGFLQNTGAMAATFTIVGIICAAALTAGFMVWRKKRRSEEHDIFESEYHDYNADSSFKANDMSALGDGASISGYSQHIDTGYNIPPPPSGLASNRSSTVSNHAGYGAFKNSARNQGAQAPTVQPPSAAMRQKSSLRNEVQIPSNRLYQEPAVDENQSIYLMPNAAGQQDQRYSADSFYSSGKMDSPVGTAQ